MLYGQGGMTGPARPRDSFALQFGTASFLYNAVLMVYYVLTIRFSIREAVLSKLLMLFHSVPLGFGIVTSSVALALGWYANSNLWCWIAGFEDAPIYRWELYYGPLWFSFFVVLAGMLIIYHSVHSKDRESAKFDAASRHRQSIHQQSTGNRRLSRRETIVQRQEAQSFRRAQNERSRKVASQALFYVIVFYLTYFFSTVNRLYQHITGGKCKYGLLPFTSHPSSPPRFLQFSCLSTAVRCQAESTEPNLESEKAHRQGSTGIDFYKRPNASKKKVFLHFSSAHIPSSIERYLTQVDDSTQRQTQEETDLVDDQPSPQETGQETAIDSSTYVSNLKGDNDDEEQQQAHLTRPVVQGDDCDDAVSQPGCSDS